MGCLPGWAKVLVTCLAPTFTFHFLLGEAGGFLPVVFGQGITHLPRPYGLFFYRRRDVVRWFRRRSRRRWPRSTCSV